MSTYEYGKLELDKINKDKDGFQESINNMILDLLKLFDEQGHSGTTAHYVINAFTKLASFKPLFPLTDEDDEWEKVGTDMWQNKRCSSVFKDSNGAYDIDGMIVSDNGGYTWFTSRDFTKYITFPYVPDKPTKVYIDKEGTIITDNPDKIKELYEKAEQEYKMWVKDYDD